jgi:TRAP-type C4-dicarboxylate transport system permease small subunit
VTPEGPGGALSAGVGQHARTDVIGPGAAETAPGLLPPAPPAPWPVRTLGAAVDWAVVAMGATMIVLVFVNVVLHVFHHDLAWVIELSEFMMVWVTFLGGAAAARRGAHMRITEFVEKLAPDRRRWAEAAIHGVAIGVLVLLVWYGVRLVNAGWTNELTVLGWPMALQYLGLPVGSACTLVFVLHDLWRTVTGPLPAGTA